MRVAGVNLPENKSIYIALTYIFGIGTTSSHNICKAVEVDPIVKVKDLTEENILRLLNVINANYVIEGELRKQIALNIKFLKDIGCYKGIRHRKKLPVRGQRTHTNARTTKGKARIPVAGKKKVV